MNGVSMTDNSVELVSHSGIDLSSFSDLLRDMDNEVYERQKSETVRKNKSTRLAEWYASADEIDIEKLMDLHERMSNFVDGVFAKVDSAEAKVLTKGELVKLMAEYVELTEIREALEARHWRIRGMFFRHLNAKYLEEGVEEPENQSGVEEVPELGKKFHRYGTGRKSPDLNQSRLKYLLGDDWDQVVEKTEVPERVIPAHTVEKFSEDRLLGYLRKNPEKLEAVRESLIPGEAKPAKFQVRSI